MKVNGRHFETLWLHPDNQGIVQIIDQRYLPFEFRIEDLATVRDVFRAIREMHLRGAPLIGVAAAMGMYLAVLQAPPEQGMAGYISRTAQYLRSARPTAVNLAWAVDRMSAAIMSCGTRQEMNGCALESALALRDEERVSCLKIGQNGLAIVEEISRTKGDDPVNILTHCNAGWLACIDYGTALAPIYLAHDKGIRVHVWVDETRPRNQGARLTAWELKQHGIPCTVITDNAGGYLMQQGRVDLVLVGCDRASPFGDIVNKVGTYLKALAAIDNKVPFYAALPASTIDWELEEGASNAPVEERDADEVRYADGWLDEQPGRMLIMPDGTAVSNYGFDITPARYVTGIITERGITKADRNQILKLFPEKTKNPPV